MIHIIIVGDTCSGKSSIFNNIQKMGFSDSYVTTISPTYTIRDNYVFYDTPSSERFLHFATPYVRIADIVIICHDITKTEETTNWEEYVTNISRKKLPTIHLYTKNDLVDTTINKKILVSSKTDNVFEIIQPFLNELTVEPKISMSWIQYLLYYVPTVEDAAGHWKVCVVQ